MPTSILDSYAILGVPPSATLVQIKAAYTKLILAQHPDKTGGGDATKFLETHNAYKRVIGALSGASTASANGTGTPDTKETREPPKTEPDEECFDFEQQATRFAEAKAGGTEMEEQDFRPGYRKPDLSKMCRTERLANMEL
ncbi:hypothetical protein BS50DRAFT_575506 [Corynespora cassiicola Philippines]|uniref:J domain-containing protein n=1 Tax=Corynespora cassiicola Philippines TaxID=1448308 RepID=A0A2T2NJA1_CORCC|nr:hypothetical protein BS50DRAFT_575506 [Corynespora cassiicola Philippines]